MARPRLGNAGVLHAHWPGTLKRSADIDRLFRSLALPTGGSLRHRYFNALRCRIRPKKARPFLRDANFMQGAGLIS